MDGTVAMRGDRDPYDFSRVNEDSLNVPITNLLKTQIEAGFGIIFVSGREEYLRDETLLFLGRFMETPITLFLRQNRDYRSDEIIKREIYETHIKDAYEIAFVLDDRDRTVAMWRKQLGLTTLQVAEGDF